MFVNNVSQKESQYSLNMKSNNNNNTAEINDEEDFENDIYLIELHKRLTSMKNERKKAENDEKLLVNRLNLLKGEEDKVC